MKYDDASWHHGGDFPSDLPPEAGGTHTGMFVAWALLNGLGRDLHVETFPQDVSRLESRAVTPGQFFMEACDGKFTEEDLNDQGNAFAADYFDFERGAYLKDYQDQLTTRPGSLYYIEDSWSNFDKMAPVISSRFEDWVRGRR